MSDIIITPNKGSANAPTIQFSGSANASASIRLEVLPEGQVAFLGKSGSLFSISDNMVGSLMAVSDISGLPILEVFSDDRIIMGKYNKNTLYVSGTNVGVRKVPLNAVLDVSGSVAVTGSLGVAGSILADGGVTASLLGTASYALNALTASYSYSGTSGTSGTSGISGGTANYVARFTGATTLSTGVIYDNATNVGIGTNGPSELLEVAGKAIIGTGVNSGNSLTVIGNSGNGLKQKFQFQAASGQYNWFIGAATNATQTLSIGASTATDGDTMATPIININQNGNVGIGTPTPTSQLTIYGAAGISAGVDDDNRAAFGYSAGRLYFGTRVASVNYFDALNIESGNVGIGTITPAQKLSVNGTMQWAQTTDAGYSGYLTNASTNAAYNPAITRNLIGSTGSTYTIAHGDMDAYAGIQFGISGTTTNAGNISFFAASGTFATNESVTPVARMFIANTGDVSISSTTAGSSNAGALVVQGGISVGNTGSAASYFGGSIDSTRTSSGNYLNVGTTNAESGFTLSRSGAIKWYLANTNATDNLYIYSTAAGTVLTFAQTTGAATFAGDVAVSKATPNFTLTNTSASTAAQFQAQSPSNRALILGQYGDSSAGTTLGLANAAGSYIQTATAGSPANYPDKLVISTQGRAAPIYFGTNNTLALTLDGTTQAATFAGAVTAGAAAFDRLGLNSNPINTVSTAQSFARFQSTGADFYTGTESSTSGSFFPSSTAYAAVLYNSAATPMHFYTSGTLRATISAAGDVTFGGAVTVGGDLFVTGNNAFLGSTTVGGAATPKIVVLASNGDYGIGFQGAINGAIRSGVKFTTASSLGGLDFMVGGDNNTDASVTALTLASNGAATFAGAVTVSAQGASGLIVGNNLANNGATIQLLGRSSGFNNWMLATSFYVANGNIGLVPSTTVGGSTFSTPVFELTPTGAATFAGAVTTGGNLTLPAASAGYRLIVTGTNNTGTGQLVIQAGGGSAEWGGTLNLFETAHATKGGYVGVGLGVSGAKFTVNSSGFSDSGEVASIDRSGNATFAGAVTVSGTQTNLGGAVFTTTNNVNIRGTNAGIAIYNSVSGSSNNWSTIRNTAAGSDSNLIFSTNTVPALTLDGSANATFAGAVTVSTSGAGQLTATTSGTDRAEVKIVKTSGTSQTWALSTAGSANGYGSADRSFSIVNADNGVVPFTISAGPLATTTVNFFNTGATTFAGDVSAQRLEAVDAAANNRAAAFIRTQNNTTYSSSVLSIQGDRTTTNASYNLIYATNGDLTGVFAVRDSGNAVNTNNSYGSISDRKLKENIVDATSKLEKLNQVRIVNFNRIGNEQKQLGVIAQELEQIFPSMIEEVIDRDAEGNDLGTTTKSVKYSVFVPMLIKAIQELTARLAALEAK